MLQQSKMCNALKKKKVIVAFIASDVNLWDGDICENAVKETRALSIYSY